MGKLASDLIYEIENVCVCAFGTNHKMSELKYNNNGWDSVITYFCIMFVYIIS